MIAVFCTKNVGILAVETLLKYNVSISSIITMPGECEKKLKLISKKINASFFSGVCLKNKEIQKKIMKTNPFTAICVSYPKVIPLSLIDQFDQSSEV